MAAIPLFLFSALLASGPVEARDWRDIRASGILKAATEGAFRPFNYFEGTRLKGFEIELAGELAGRLGLGLDWKTLPFDSLLIGLSQDRYDLVAASHGVTAERERAVDFSIPHYCTGGVIVSKKDGPRTASELKGRVVGVQVGTTYYQHLRRLPGIREVKTYPKDSDVLESLMQGRVDAWVGDRFTALDAVKAHPAAGLRLGELLFTEKIAMAAAKGNKGLLDRVNGALRAALKDGTYRRLSLKYFGQDIRCP